MNAGGECIDTARTLVADDKGLLAMDESNPTCNQRFARLGIPQTEEARRVWRELIVTTPGLGQCISGAILYDETIRQQKLDGTSFVNALNNVGIIPGIKVDTGAKDMAGHPREKITDGLEGLSERLKEYFRMGARFAKWRAVIVIGDGIPSRACIKANAQALARYAVLCQEAGLVPIIEPEVLMDGDHSLARCCAVTEEVLRTVFSHLGKQGVALEGMILKPNMVLPGLSCPRQETIDEVADATVECLLRVVPAAVAGIAFLSGGQSGQLASARLNAMNLRFKSRLPWPLTYSFSRAIQQPALGIWRGEKSRVAAAQQAIFHRARCNRAARRGEYTTAMEQTSASQHESPNSQISGIPKREIQQATGTHPEIPRPLMSGSPLAGQPAPASMLINVPRLVTAYYAQQPEPSVPLQRVQFGTSGHRGSAFARTFNESHILSIAQAICDYRTLQKIEGPLFLGIDTHALSVPAFATALEVLAANEVDVMIASADEYTPTPAISHAILTHNRGRTSAFADGAVITPSHNPPEYGGFKYNPPHGGPAETVVTQWIETKANEYLERNLRGVRRISYGRALDAPKTHCYDFLDAYTSDLASVIDFDVIRSANISSGVDPLGGAGVHYWRRIAERFKLDLTPVNETVDPAFGFMSVDWDGQIRMDPSSSYAMHGLISLKDRFRIAFACDTDHDRHGIVTPGAGLLPANDYLSVAIFYLFKHRPQWDPRTAVGKTIVSSRMIDRVAAKLDRPLHEVPVGFKWFVDGLFNASLGFAGEESAGASFLRRNGTVWTTDKDGIAAALLSAEITARLGRDPGEVYRDLTAELGMPFYARKDAPASQVQKQVLKHLSAEQMRLTELAGEPVQRVLTHMPGNGAPIDGVKVETANAWFAARPSGTEDVYKIYAESFQSADHLRLVLKEAQMIVDNALGGSPDSGKP